MTRRAAAVLVALLVAGVPRAGVARGWHGGHGGHFHGHGFHGPSVFFGFGYYPFYDPYLGPYYYSPYYYPYPYPIYPAPYPALPGDVAEAPAPEAPPAQEPEEQASYGLVQLHGVPDGAEVDLDGRLWLRAQDIGQRWLALPEGTHTLKVRVKGAEPVERRIDVAAGRMQVVRFDVRAPA
jgi:hypothetical protein